MTAVAVTGASGSLGTVLLDRLSNNEKYDRIVALDIAEPVRLPSRVEFHRADVRDPEFDRYLEGCDQLLHLAFIVERGSRDPELVEAVNVGGTRNVLESAARSGVSSVVYASSIAAYGVHPENLDGPLDESAPIRGNDFFYYSRTKADVERWLDRFEQEHEGVAVARLRPSIFLGRSGKRSLAGRLPLFPYFHGSDHPVHVTHEEDVADAFLLALEQRATGAFNIASDEPIPVADWPSRMGKYGIPLPRASVKLMELAYARRLIDVEPTWIRFGERYPIMVTSERAKRELGWKPRFGTTSEVLAELTGGAGPSRPVRTLFGFLARVTSTRGSLPIRGDENESMSGSLDFLLTGPRASAWHVWTRGGRVGVGRGRDPEARATVKVAEEDFIAVISGTLDWSTAMMIGKVRFSGDGEFAMVAGGLVQGIKQLVSESQSAPWGRRALAQGLRIAAGLPRGGNS